MEKLRDAEKIGFIIPEGYFFLDIDHRDTQSDLVQILLKQFQTYTETSPAATVFTFTGLVTVTKNLDNVI